jgi:biotin carboxyl carrier protein
MSYRALINGKIVAEFDQTLNGVEEISPGVYSVLRDGKSFVVRLLLDVAGSYEVALHGYEFVLQLEDPRDAASINNGSEQSGRIEVKSAMPGKVVRVLVRDGDLVEPGQSLIVVEAMKMQNELKSPKTGRVVKINASEGATVQAGQVLVVLE